MVAATRSATLSPTVKAASLSHSSPGMPHDDVWKLLRELGFYVIDLGNLAVGSALQQAGGPLSGVDILKAGESERSPA